MATRSWRGAPRATSSSGSSCDGAMAGESGDGVGGRHCHRRDTSVLMPGRGGAGASSRGWRRARARTSLRCGRRCCCPWCPWNERVLSGSLAQVAMADGQKHDLEEGEVQQAIADQAITYVAATNRLFNTELETALIAQLRNVTSVTVAVQAGTVATQGGRTANSPASTSTTGPGAETMVTRALRTP